MKIIHFTFIILLSLFVTSCGTVQVSTDYDRSANFASYKTYTFHQKGLDKLKVNDLDKNRLIKAIDAQMATKGFTKVSSDADLVINLLTSSKEQVSVNNNNWSNISAKAERIPQAVQEILAKFPPQPKK